MVPLNAFQTREEKVLLKENNIKFATAVDQNKCLEKIKFPISLHTCAPIFFELPSKRHTTGAHDKQKGPTVMGIRVFPPGSNSSFLLSLDPAPFWPIFIYWITKKNLIHACRPGSMWFAYYRMFKKSSPMLWCSLVYKMGQDFFTIRRFPPKTPKTGAKG